MEQNTAREQKSPRLLAMLEGDYLPRARGRDALRRSKTPPPDAVLRSVRVPSWRWVYKGPDAKARLAQEMVYLDANAAWLTAASSVNVARDELQHTGPLAFYPRLPGYYQVLIGDEDPWDDVRLMSPLGQAAHREAVWLPEPVVTLLAELAQKDQWPELVILDSWTSTEKCRLTAWTNQLRAMRVDLIESGDKQALARFKVAYSQAVTMIQGDEQCQMRRADWHHAIRAQHTANLWRKTWKCVNAGHGPIASGKVDALMFTQGDFMAIQQLTPPPLRLDQSGMTFGTFKVDAVGSFEQLWDE